MQNGQLKSSYNVQIVVENYFVVHTYVSNDRTDYNILIPVLEKRKEAFEKYPENVMADSGYCSEKNLLFLKENKVRSCINCKPTRKEKPELIKMTLENITT